MKKINLIFPSILFFCLFIFLQSPLQARKCFDYILLDGDEKLVSFGMDTTQHWWALTAPFAENYRLTIDGESSDVFRDIKSLTFSADGNRWAFFGKDNVQWYIISNDTIITIPGFRVGEIAFSPNSQHLIYSYFEAEEEVIIFKDQIINVYNKSSKLYISQNAEKYAFVVKRGDGFIININGKETQTYDDIFPIGFWYDTKLLFAAKNGNYWEIFKTDKVISETYENIFEVTINLQGTVAVALASELSGEGTDSELLRKSVGILISDEYYEPLIGSYYDKVYNLTLHPELPLIAYNAKYEEQYMVVLNSTEYSGGTDVTGPPTFTCDGEDLFFLGCDTDCFVNVNGMKFKLNTDLPVDRAYAKKPGSNTIAYSTNSSMIIRDLNTQDLYAGTMVDELIQPRYNWRTNLYETLGRISNRLYLMTCTD